MIKSKKLSSLVAASLILAGGSFLGVQTVSADDATRLAAVEALASQNHSSISELTEKVNNISTTPEQLQQIDTNKDNITKNQTAIQTNADAIKKNSDDITANKTAADTAIQANADAIKKNSEDIAANKTAADTAIQANADAIKKNSEDIAANKTAADTAIQTNADAIKKNSEDIAANKTAADTAIKANADAIKKNSDAITANKTAADTAIQANTESITKIQDDLKAANLDEMSKTAASLKNYDTQMSTVQALAAGNKDNIDKNKTAIDQNKSDIATNKSDIATNKADIATNKADIATNKADIATNKADIATNKADIATNKSDIATNKSDIATNKSDIATNKADIATNKADIAQEVKNRTKAVADEAAARESGDNALQSQIKKESAARQADISRLDNKIHDVSKEVDTVGALSMAMSGLHPLSYDEGDARFQLSAAVGTYDGTEALALGGFYHFNRDSMLSVGVATDLGADEHRMGANVGYTRRIGQGGHVSRPSEGTVSDIMKDIKNLEQKQAKLEQENEQLKQQLAALKK